MTTKRLSNRRLSNRRLSDRRSSDRRSSDRRSSNVYKPTFIKESDEFYVKKHNVKDDIESVDYAISSYKRNSRINKNNEMIDLPPYDKDEEKETYDISMGKVAAVGAAVGATIGLGYFGYYYLDNKYGGFGDPGSQDFDLENVFINTSGEFFYKNKKITSNIVGGQKNKNVILYARENVDINPKQLIAKWPIGDLERKSNEKVKEFFEKEQDLLYKLIYI